MIAYPESTAELVGIEISAKSVSDLDRVLSPEALAFLANLQRTFDDRRRELIKQRHAIQAEIDAGTMPAFLEETSQIRHSDWQVAPPPDDLQRRWVEITGPVERKMMINALNSKADIYMADFEDATAPTWSNVIQGQINLMDAVRGTISFTNPAGKQYSLREDTATLFVRPRGWHLEESHLLIDGLPISAALFDFGLYFFHNAQALREKGSGPYFYLPKLENHHEAALWNDVFVAAQTALGIPLGTIRATVLIENILAAFEMDEILYALRDHICALNAGRWDFIFSVIKKFRNLPGFILPDRAQITMTVPFMRAYTELMVKTCHRRGAHAIGGMAAFIPNRHDPEVTARALEKVREDKVREAADGCDGTWVAHPDLVLIAREPFEKILGDQPHQKQRLREEVSIGPAELLNFEVADGEITEAGLRLNINVGIQYIAAWLEGVGAAAIFNLMEDTATAEISRAQIWQWIVSPQGILADGRNILLPLVRNLIKEELDAIRTQVGTQRFAAGKYTIASDLFEDLISADEFIEFLTEPAYKILDLDKERI